MRGTAGTSSLYFVEYLTARTWLSDILRACRSAKGCECWIYDTSLCGFVLAKVTAAFCGFPVRRMDFSIMDVRNEDGLSVRLTVIYDELLRVRQIIETDEGLSPFAAKAAVCHYDMKGAGKYGQIQHALLLIHISRWHAKARGAGDKAITVFFNDRPHLAALRKYAADHGVTAVPVRSCRPESSLVKLLRKARSVRMRDYGAAMRNIMVRRKPSATTPEGRRRPRLAVDYYGHLNLDHPERYSDLFFLNGSELRGEDTTLLFRIPEDPLDERKLAALRRRDIAAVALNPFAVTAKDRTIPVFPRFFGSGGSYEALCSYWADLFEKTGSRVHTTWFRYDENHMAITDAMKRVGGVATIYQRSYELNFGAESTASTDVLFGFSELLADMEGRIGSSIRYNVITGYLGDFRFPLLKATADAVRSRLRRNGAKKIIAFLDENTIDDGRWFPGDDFTQQSYAFIIGLVLRYPDLGLIIKPKTPRTLRRRLGSVAELLDEALRTGRCHLFDESGLQSPYPPAAAALASDVVVHEFLSAGTAAIESALCGAKTLLMDKEGWRVSPFYRLGVGTVVFNEWDALWQACGEHWKTDAGIPGFGDWSALLGELDPFRDGKAAERMGDYLAWLLQGIRAGKTRDGAMADAAGRYSDRWGRDKIREINGGGETIRPLHGGIDDERKNERAGRIVYHTGL